MAVLIETVEPSHGRACGGHALLHLFGCCMTGAAMAQLLMADGVRAGGRRQQCRHLLRVAHDAWRHGLYPLRAAAQAQGPLTCAPLQLGSGICPCSAQSCDLPELSCHFHRVYGEAQSCSQQILCNRPNYTKAGPGYVTLVQ